MIPYYCDEALLNLPNVARLIDRSRQFLEVHTEDGVQLDLVIARAPRPAKTTLLACVEADIAEQKRSLRGFELLSMEEREYEAIVGIEVRMRYIDKKEGPTYHHELHSFMGPKRVGFHGICKVAHSAACDAWMQAMLTDMTLRT